VGSPPREYEKKVRNSFTDTAITSKPKGSIFREKKEGDSRRIETGRERKEDINIKKKPAREIGREKETGQLDGKQRHTQESESPRALHHRTSLCQDIGPGGDRAKLTSDGCRKIKVRQQGSLPFLLADVGNDVNEKFYRSHQIGSSQKGRSQTGKRNTFVRRDREKPKSASGI